MLIYGSMAVTIFTMAVALSLAEMSGAYPTSGGMYHLVILLGSHFKAVAIWVKAAHFLAIFAVLRKHRLD